MKSKKIGTFPLSNEHATLIRNLLHNEKLHYRSQGIDVEGHLINVINEAIERMEHPEKFNSPEVEWPYSTWRHTVSSDICLLSVCCGNTERNDIWCSCISQQSKSCQNPTSHVRRNLMNNTRYMSQVNYLLKNRWILSKLSLTLIYKKSIAFNQCVNTLYLKDYVTKYQV